MPSSTEVALQWPTTSVGHASYPLVAQLCFLVVPFYSFGLRQAYLLRLWTLTQHEGLRSSARVRHWCQADKINAYTVFRNNLHSMNAAVQL